MIELRDYFDIEGRAPFRRWFAELDARAAARIAVTLARVEQGNLANLKSVGAGVLECRVDFGPGYRVYLGRDGDVLVILLTGGTKKRQQHDIDKAHEYREDYKRRKRGAVR